MFAHSALARLDWPWQMSHPAAMTGPGDHDDGLLKEALPFRPALVHHFKRKTANANEVEDLVQEVFLRIASRQATGAIDNIGGYIFQTAASVLTDRYRRRTVRHADDHVPFDNERDGELAFDAGRILEGQQNLRVALAAIRALPERTRTVFVLRRLDGHAYRDIASQLGISVSAVEKHMVRATQHLLSATREAQ